MGGGGGCADRRYRPPPGLVEMSVSMTTPLNHCSKEGKRMRRRRRRRWWMWDEDEEIYVAAQRGWETGGENGATHRPRQHSPPCGQFMSH